MIRQPQPSNPFFREFTALLTQAGTNAPTMEILSNTLGATPVWSYQEVGIYLLTLEGAFPQSKTYYTSVMNRTAGTVQLVIVDWVSVNQIRLVVTGGTFAPTNGYLNKTPFEIRVYTN